MRDVICLILAGIWLSGCATMIPLSNQENCALDNMKLAGISHGSMTASSYNFHTNSTTVASGYESSIQCAIIDNDKDKEQLAFLQAEMRPKLQYNSSIKAKRLATGAGYVLWLIPGIALKIIFDSQYDKAIAESERIIRTSIPQ